MKNYNYVLLLLLFLGMAFMRIHLDMNDLLVFLALGVFGMFVNVYGILQHLEVILRELQSMKTKENGQGL